NNRLVTQWLIDPRACVEDARNGVALGRRVGNRSWTFTVREKYQQALWLTGDWDAAVADARDALEEELEPADHLTLLRVLTFVRAARGEDVSLAVDEIAAVAAEVSDPQVLWIPFDT